MLKKKFIHVVLSFLVFIYIVFEELVWETLAKPIYEYIHSLKILKRMEIFIKKLHPTVVLIIFVSLFVQVELLGLFAVGVLAKGHVLTSMLLYSAKIPIGAFTFWLFKVSKDKLMRFAWFKASYDFVMLYIDKIKATEIYKDVKVQTTAIKRYIKKNISDDKDGLRLKIKRIYRRIKSRLSS